MEILLLEDIAGVGKKNDLLIVGDGFALNFLLPQRKALVATPTVRKRYAEQIRKRAEEKERERQIKVSVASALAGKSITFTKKASKNNKLYASISEKHIAQALKDQLQMEISEDVIGLTEPIKMIGIFTATIKLGETTQTLNVVVNAE